MDPLHVVEKCTKEIIENFRLPERICFPFIKKVLSWVYVAGWEEGTRSLSTRTPVIQLDKFGITIEIHRSLTDAARKTRISKSNISEVINSKQNSAGGYGWRRVSNPEEIDKILNGWQNEL